VELAARIGILLQQSKKTLSSAESCTGGMLGMMLTAVPGASLWFKGGVIAYSDSIKEDVLEVPSSVISENGAVSGETVIAMAAGIRRLTDTDISIAVSGVAGPDGGTASKPVGTVWMAVSSDLSDFVEMKVFAGDRDVVRRKAAHYLLGMLQTLLEKGV